MNILIAEDDEAIANLLYMDLSDEGYQCSVAGDGKIAADMLEANMNYDLMVYVLNGKNLGTADDRRHLDFVFENYKGEIVFVVNKLDHFKAKEDSVSDTIRQVREDLEQTGYQNPVICPVSAYAAYLARQDMQGEELNEDEREELERLHRKLNKEEYQFHRYYQEKYSITETGDDRNQQLLLHSGILSLEKILYEER